MRTEKACLLSSSSWFITFPFPSAIHSLYYCRLQHQAGLCSAHNFKAHAPPPLFFFVCFVFSLLFNQYINIFPLYCHPLLLSLSFSQRLFPFLLLPSLFSHCTSLLEWIPLAQRHQRHVSSLTVAAIYTNRLYAKARCPQGRIRSSVETHCALSRAAIVGKAKAHVRNHVIIGGIYRQKLVKYILGVVRLQKDKGKLFMRMNSTAYFSCFSSSELFLKMLPIFQINSSLQCEKCKGTE